jgi:hypothetical protein
LAADISAGAMRKKTRVQFPTLEQKNRFKVGVGTENEVLACANTCQTLVLAQVLALLAQVLE